MPQFLSDFFSGELKISTSSWHYRWYQYWEDKGGYNGWHYQENLCHYMRVLLLWAPRRWFIHASTLRGWVRPWLVFFELDVLAITVVSYMIWPDKTLLGLLVALLVAAAFAADLGFVWVLRQKRTEVIGKYLWEKTGPYLRPAGKFLWAGICAAARPTWRGIRFTTRMIWRAWTPVGNGLYGICRAVRRWSWEHDAAVPGTILTLMVAAILAFLGWFAYTHLVAFLILTGAALFLVPSALLGSARFDKWDKAHPGAAFPGSKFAKGVAGTVKVAAHFAVAKKRKICPFISFETEEGHLQAA